jgi:nucleotide-binding universal stress UspA family protein
MFKNVLVPLDGSELAERAIPYASELAGPQGKVMLVRATMAHHRLHNSPTSEADAIGEAEHYLKEVTNRFQDGGAQFEWHTYYGPAPEAILDETVLRRCDTIVMSTHGRGGLERFLYGSVAEQVIAHSLVPVLLIPARCQLSWPPAEGSRVLVALDGSDVAESALEPAIRLAQRLHLPLRLLEVIQPSETAYYDLTGPLNDTRVKDAETYLGCVQARLQARQLLVGTEVNLGRPSDVIADVAQAERTAAVVMSTHGRDGVARLVMGSVTAGVLHQAAVPMLVVRPAAVERVVEPSSALQAAF